MEEDALRTGFLARLVAVSAAVACSSLGGTVGVAQASAASAPQQNAFAADTGHSLAGRLGYGNVANRSSGRCLDAADFGTGTDVIQWGCLGAAHQRWALEAVGGGYYQVRNEYSGKCLDASNWGAGTDVIQWTCHGHPNQHWTIPRG